MLKEKMRVDEEEMKLYKEYDIGDTKCPDDYIKVIEYDSINSFLKYIENATENKGFNDWQVKRGCTLESKREGEYYTEFTGTKSLKDACDMIKNGWAEEAKKIEKDLNLNIKNNVNRMQNKTIYDTVGFQVSVPRYLNGIPTSMINQKKVVVKNKIIDISKHIGYYSKESTEKIEKESIKALTLINELEKSGFRINLYVVAPSEIAINLSLSNIYGDENGEWAKNENPQKIMLKVKIKGSNERLNVSKMAFPLVHPSMLRRLKFRWLETFEKVHPAFTVGYGRSIYNTNYLRDMIHRANKNEYFIPNFINNDIKDIRTLDDLNKLC